MPKLPSTLNQVYNVHGQRSIMHCINEVLHTCKGHMLTYVQHQKWSTVKGILSEEIWKHMPHWACWWPSKFCKSQCWSHFTRSFISEPTHPRWTSTILHYIYKHMVYFNAWQPQLCWAAIHNAKLALRIAHPSCFIHPCACDIFGFTTYIWHMHMIVLQVHLRKPCYDLSFLAVIRFPRFNIALIR